MAKKQLKQGTKQAGPELNTMVDKVRSVVPSVSLHFLSLPNSSVVGVVS